MNSRQVTALVLLLQCSNLVDRIINDCWYWPLACNPSNTPIRCKVNGQLFQLFRVIGGLPTSIDKYPILAQLLLDSWGNNNFIQHCAGVILTVRHVISTAHCFQYNFNTGLNYTLPKYWKIRVGSTSRSRGGMMYNIKKILPHQDFDSYYYTNDIAVILVSKPFVLGPKVRQGTIISRGVNIKPNSVCTLIGWGSTEVDGPQPDQLQYAMMYTIDQKICAARYRTIKAVIDDKMICAGLLDLGGVDGCFGDSGGPLIYKGLVVGLVSFGYSCGNPYYPGVYTKISSHTEWIVKTISANKN